MKPPDRMRVLVTGAAGGIGAVTITRLLAAGYVVRALVRPAEAHLLPPRVERVTGDSTDPDTVRAAVGDAGAVVHMAAIANPIAAPAHQVFTNNVTATFVVLDAAGELGVQRAIIASSLAALGLAWAGVPASPHYLPLDEEHPSRPVECYGLSKQVDEMTVAMIARRYGMTVLAYRFPFTTTSARIAERADRIQRNPGEAANELWAYLDVRDAADAVLRGLEAPVEGYHVINIAAPDTLADDDTEPLVKRFHPHTQVRAPLPGRITPYATQRAVDLLGFHSRFTRSIPTTSEKS